MRVILIERAATGAKKQGGAAGPAHVYGCSIGLESIKNPCAQIAFTRIRQHDHNGLARIGGLLCQRQSGADRRARRDADEDALGACDLARHGCGVCRLNRADLVIDRAVKCLGDEIRADALDAMRACLALRQQRRVGRLHRDDVHVGLVLLEIPASARDRAARAHTRNEHVHVAVGVLPDLRAGGLIVCGRVGRKELEDAAWLDGANDIQFYIRVVVPLSKAIMAVMILFYGVEAWNSWLPAFLYMSSREKYPLQLILREIIIQGTSSSAGDNELIGDGLKYATMVVTALPIMCLYPFLQKYFTKGVMIGSVKG